MHLSLVICTRNRGALIRETLESVLSGTCLPDEIVVVDQSDDMSTRDAVLQLGQSCPRLRYVRTPTRGLSRARNIGLQETLGNIIVWTDDDVVVDRIWIETILTEFQAFDDLMLLYGTVLPPDTYDWRTEFIPHVRLSTHRPVSLFDGAAMMGIGANMAMRRKLIETVGPFNALLGTGSIIPCAEDFDMTLRALTHSPPLRVHQVNEAQVVHYAGARRGEEYKRFVHATGYGIGRFWGYSLRSSAPNSHARWLYLIKFHQELGRYWRQFLNHCLSGQHPPGFVTHLYLLTAFWRQFLFPSHREVPYEGTQRSHPERIPEGPRKGLRENG